MPYDQFIREQLAADHLNYAKNPGSLAAMGFLTLGDHFNGNANDIINDRIDVTTKAFLGLTVTCARCHDHKFDPIPTADYYSLYGIFASSAEPARRPVIASGQCRVSGLSGETPRYGSAPHDDARRERQSACWGITGRTVPSIFSR